MTHPFSPTSHNPHQQLFASVVLAALDDAIAEERHHGTGADGIARWAKSRDGQTILRCAGIEPSHRCVAGLRKFVTQGIKTSTALTKEGPKSATPAKPPQVTSDFLHAQPNSQPQTVMHGILI